MPTSTSISLSSSLRIAVSQVVGMGVSAFALTTPLGATAGAFPAVFELSTLDGTNGFVVPGVGTDPSSTGYSVSAAGDINGDGSDDILISAPTMDVGEQLNAGIAYVVFGGPEVGAQGSVQLAGLDGSNGFVLEGVDAKDSAGASVSGVSDVNGDGVTEILIGAIFANPHGRWDAGQGYLVFGGPTVGRDGRVELERLDWPSGLTLSGTHIRSETGGSVRGAGDFNGDGYGDAIVGANWADPAGRADAGQSYVVFGGPQSVPGGELFLPLLNGVNGIVINGIGIQDFSGRSVGEAGDVNGDGFDDVLIGASHADVNEFLDAGAAYVVFGHPPPFMPQLELADLDGKNGFALTCEPEFTSCGVAVGGAGDLNGDGYDDIVVGAPNGNAYGLYSGMSYVVFGGPNVGGDGSLRTRELNGDNGFAIYNTEAGTWTGWSVGRAGDLNGDGTDDLALGATYGDPQGRTDAGATYIIYGREDIGFDGKLLLSSLNGENGFVLNGIDPSDRSGHSVRLAGDINVDGIDDLLIGAFNAAPNGVDRVGEVYVVFGRSADTDNDGIDDSEDNCTNLGNADQRDTNADGYGNACDPDLDDNGIVNFADLGQLKLAFFGSAPDADLDGDGKVNFVDLGIMKSFFFLPPGPSGLDQRGREPVNSSR